MLLKKSDRERSRFALFSELAEVAPNKFLQCIRHQKAILMTNKWHSVVGNLLVEKRYVGSSYAWRGV
ncbi:hypothetical protein AAC387_Pa07g2265 [Persea americana]